MTAIIARPQLPDELTLPKQALVIVEEGPAIDAGEVEHRDGHRIVVGAHMTEQLHIRCAAIPLGAASVDPISIIVRAASGVPIILGAIHEDAILAFGFDHRGE